MTSDVLEVITAKTASFLSGIVEGDKPCNDPSLASGENAEQLENDETGSDDC